jgi:hypothetical protein
VKTSDVFWFHLLKDDRCNSGFIPFKRTARNCFSHILGSSKIKNVSDCIAVLCQLPEVQYWWPAIKMTAIKSEVVLIPALLEMNKIP